MVYPVNDELIVNILGYVSPVPTFQLMFRFLSLTKNIFHNL